MKRTDIKVGFLCNNLCLFCVQGNKRDIYGNKTFKTIQSELKRGAKNSKELVLTGGESTLHKDFLQIVQSAKRAGYECINIQTNGRLFAYREFCKKSILAGADSFCIAVHGHNAKIHDALTRAPGSFVQSTAGIKNLKSLGARVSTNTVITTKNYRSIPKIAALLISLGVDQMQFAFPHIIGDAWNNRATLIPMKTKVMPYIMMGLDLAVRAHVTAMTEAIPYCLMKDYEDFVAEKTIPQTQIFDAGFTVKDYTKYRKNIGKAKTNKCRSCFYDTVCEGPWREYPKLFGWSEFIPVKYELV